MMMMNWVLKVRFDCLCVFVLLFAVGVMDGLLLLGLVCSINGEYSFEFDISGQNNSFLLFLAVIVSSTTIVYF